MYSTKIFLKDVSAVKKFVEIASRYDFPVILSAKNCIVNGRSIMGIFSLDLSKPIKVECPEDCDPEFLKSLKDFQEE